jgi:hypothetical protein
MLYALLAAWRDVACSTLQCPCTEMVRQLRHHRAVTGGASGMQASGLPLVQLSAVWFRL